MHSFLVSVPPDFPPGPDILKLVPEKSLGIEDVRSLQTFLSRKPLKLPQNIGIILDADKLTPAAQHALLKTLEEPPGNSLIYLVTTHPDQLLSTIISRVQIEEAGLSPVPDPAHIMETEKVLQSLITAPAGKKLEIIDSLNFTRLTALDFLYLCEHVLHTRMHASQNQFLQQEPNLFRQITLSRIYLKSNVNVRLAMDNFALNI